MRKGAGDQAEQNGGVRPAGRVASASRAVAIAVIVVSLALIARHLPIGPMVEGLSGWVRGLGVWGPVVYGLIYVVAVVALLPASALTIAAGAIFGPVVGTILVSIGSTVGAALAFLIARHLAREAVARRARRYPRFEAIDRAIGTGGWRIVAMLRLSPAVPFNLQNYLYGLTRIGFWPCVLTSWVAMFPGTLLYVNLGYAGRAGLEAASGGRTRGPAEWAILGVGLAATVLVTVYVTRLARKALRDQSALASDPVEPTGAEGDREALSSAGWGWGTTILVCVAIGTLALAIFVQVRPDAVERLFPRRAAPPPVVLREATVDNSSSHRVDVPDFDALPGTHASDGGPVEHSRADQDADE